jgi:endoglucanase
MKKNRVLIFFCIINFFSINAQTSTWDIVEQMGRGINLGNTLSAPVEGNWATVVYEQYFIDVANEGFSNVRMPMDFFGDRTSGATDIWSTAANTASDFNGTITDYLVSDPYLDRVETVVNWSLDQGLYTIIDFHGAELKSEFLETFNLESTNYAYPTSAKRAADLMKFKSIWIQIANRFINHPSTLIFEVVNEPYFEVSAQEMDEINLMIIEVIRLTGGNNSSRPIVITGGTSNSYQAPTAIGTEVLNSDSNLIASFHYYIPFNFTSSSTSNNNDFNWGTTNDKSTVNTHFDSVKTWSETNNIPITLGEFGADNEGGYNYQTGVYGDNGGPVNSDRVEYHRYIAEQAINRGFSFSAWCSGNKSNKTIHLRTDNPTTLNAVAGVWVEDVKEALLSDGTWPECYGPTLDQIILNPDFECGITSSWNFTTLGNAVASISESSNSIFSGNYAARIQVTASDTYNKVILSNIDYQQDLTDKKITIGCYAKSSTSGTSFKLRIKSEDNYSMTNSNYTASPTFSLSTSYNYYSFEYIVPQNTTSVQAQVLMGEEVGVYFLDAFDVLVEDYTLGMNLSSLNLELIISPNPVRDNLYLNTNHKILMVKIYDMLGHLILTQIATQSIAVESLSEGVYIAKVKFENGAILTKKFVKN